MTKEDQVEKILDELEEEFAKANMPVNDKLTLFAKVSNAIYKYAEQEPCVDAISRQAALDAVCEGQCGCKMSDCEYLFADCSEIEKIKQLPPVKPTEKVGQWIDEGDSSRCGELSCCKGNYCSECGAKMEDENG